MGEAITFEPERDGIFVVRYSRVPTEEEFVAYLARALNVTEGNEYFGLMCVADGDGVFTPAQRTRQADWNRLHTEKLRASCWGTAFVLPSALARLVLVSVMTLQRLPYRHKVIATREQAFAWLEHMRPARAQRNSA